MSEHRLFVTTRAQRSDHAENSAPNRRSVRIGRAPEVLFQAKDTANREWSAGFGFSDRLKPRSRVGSDSADSACDPIGELGDAGVARSQFVGGEAESDVCRGSS